MTDSAKTAWARFLHCCMKGQQHLATIIYNRCKYVTDMKRRSYSFIVRRIRPLMNNFTRLSSFTLNNASHHTGKGGLKEMLQVDHPDIKILQCSKTHRMGRPMVQDDSYEM